MHSLSAVLLRLDSDKCSEEKDKPLSVFTLFMSKIDKILKYQLQVLHRLHNGQFVSLGVLSLQMRTLICLCQLGNICWQFSYLFNCNLEKVFEIEN